MKNELKEYVVVLKEVRELVIEVVAVNSSHAEEQAAEIYKDGSRQYMIDFLDGEILEDETEVGLA